MEKVKTLKDKLLNNTEIQNMLTKGSIVKYAMYALISLTLFLFVVYILYKLRLKKKNNNQMRNGLNEIKIKIRSIPYKEASNPLRDYYVCSSYNSCCGGDFKNDFVDTGPLVQVINKGARLLDFEIYSVNNKPVVSASSQKSFNIKETYNSLPFSEVIDTIKMVAFSGTTSPNPNDPLFINLRIKSNNIKIYEEMANILNSSIGLKLLGKKYHYEAGGFGIVKEPLHNFLNKVIIICNDENGNFRKVDKFHKLVNMSSSSIFLRELRYYDILYTPDFKELIYHNKKNMTLVVPDLSEKDENMNSDLLFKYGCQFNCMSFQNADNLLKYYLETFNEANYAFMLKPKQLRYVPITINKPKKQNTAYSYAPRNIDKPYFKSLI